ncbi:MAG TPA: zinc ribbon domain-containing protein [Firmicutes bacterium]|jgi:putative FmdB family regulatory protein|nr:zinc ribbon domain-containing protein [Bacillota bacterium]
MPTYEYKCAKCGRFEYEQRITEPALETCPTCGGKVSRLISRNVNIVFKGPGFYVTDNRKGSSSDSTSSSSSSTEEKVS